LPISRVCHLVGCRIANISARMRPLPHVPLRLPVGPQAMRHFRPGNPTAIQSTTVLCAWT